MCSLSVANENNRKRNMKVPPTNVHGFAEYEDGPFFNSGGTAQNSQPNVQAPMDDTDFSEYMWMANEEEFDKEVLQRLEEEELMEQCMLQHMLNGVHPAQNSASTNGHSSQPKVASGETVKMSTLNPYAAEFVPSWGRNNFSATQKST